MMIKFKIKIIYSKTISKNNSSKKRIINKIKITQLKQ